MFHTEDFCRTLTKPPKACLSSLRDNPEFQRRAGLTFSVLVPFAGVFDAKTGSRRSGALATSTAVLAATIPQAALAGCYGGYGYGYAYASPAYRFAYSPWGYRSAYYPHYAGWGWRGWGHRHSGWGWRRW
jgi:hypothetical protein